MAVTFVNSAVYNTTTLATTHTITIPTVATGDVALLFIGYASGATTVTSVVGGPTWTQVGTMATMSGNSSGVWSAPLTTADTAASVTVTISSSIRCQLIMMVLRGLIGTGYVECFSSKTQSVSTTTPTTPTVTTGASGDVEVGAVFMGNSTTAIASITSGTFTNVVTSLNTVASGTIAAAAGLQLTQVANGVVLGGDSFTADQAKGYTAWTVGMRGTVTNLDPTVSATPDTLTVSAGATANLNFTASDPDGSIASRATTFDWPTSGNPTITGGTTATPSFVVPSGITGGQRYVVRQTVTDNDGATAFDTCEVRVPATALTGVRCTPVDGVGAWSLVGSATTDGAALSDEDVTTRLESATVTATETEHAVQLNPIPAGLSSMTLKLNLRHDVAGSSTLKVRLREGGATGTVRQEWTQSGLTVTDTQYSFTVSGATLSAITDYGNLWVSVAATT